MRHTKRTHLVTAFTITLLTAGTALAAPPPATSLNKCQNAVKVEGTKFIQGYLNAAGACLQRVSTDVVQNNLGTPSTAAANTCVTQYRKISDTRALGKSLVEKLQAKILAKCAPGGNNTHTLQDILGSGASVAQPLDAENLGAYCSGFGGDGSIDTLQEWVDCITAVHTCAARSALTSRYPRLLDYLPLVQPVMSGLTPPATDLTKISDAVAGLSADDTAIDGGTNDGQPELFCGPGILSSGDAVAAEVLSGKTFSNNSAAGLTGTMPNNGTVNITPSIAAQTIAAGYHNGSGSVAGDADLISSNIRFGSNIFGVSGNVIQATGNAGLGDVLAGKTFSNIGGSGTGTMPNNGAVVLTPTTSDQTIAAGYHNGAGVCEGDADLLAGNIKSGVDLFGVSGDPNVVDTAGATATAPDMVSGTTAWANGSLVTGTASAGANVNGANGLKTFTIPDGLYSGSKTATANDTNLVAGNIVTGTTIFGVTGSALPGQRMKTGQTQCWDGAGTLIACAGTGHDGELQKGLTVSFTDNGDGTITDNRTGLMWEKLDDNNANGIHDFSATFTWTNAFNKVKVLNGDATGCLAANNPDACCTGAGTGSCSAFGGHTDWRLPNINELQSLANYGTFSPAVNASFQTGCVAACTTSTCSCTQSSSYWSATTRQDGPASAWFVSFISGFVFDVNKTASFYVRGVRGGS